MPSLQFNIIRTIIELESGQFWSVRSTRKCATSRYCATSWLNTLSSGGTGNPRNTWDKTLWWESLWPKGLSPTNWEKGDIGYIEGKFIGRGLDKRGYMLMGADWSQGFRSGDQITRRWRSDDDEMTASCSEVSGPGYLKLYHHVVPMNQPFSSQPGFPTVLATALRGWKDSGTSPVWRFIQRLHQMLGIDGILLIWYSGEEITEIKCHTTSRNPCLTSFNITVQVLQMSQLYSVKRGRDSRKLLNKKFLLELTAVKTHWRSF